MSLAAGSALAQAGGQLYSGISQGDMYHYQAEVAAMNAKIAGQNQAYSAGAASTQAEDASLHAAEKLSGVRAGFAANNLDVNSGSAARVQESQREVGNLDTATVASNAAQRVYGYASEKSGFEATESADQTAATTSVISGIAGAGGSLLSSASNTPSLFSWMNSGSGGEDASSLSGSEPDASMGTFEDPF